MTDGTILIGGTAGLEVGMRMKRGLIVVGGLVRDFAGLQMKGGTIVLRSGAELRTGAWMIRGTIVSLKPIPLLPTFSYASTYNPTFLRLYAKHLATLGFTIPYEDQDGAYQRYTGDTSIPGKGEILVWKPRDGHDAGDDVGAQPWSGAECRIVDTFAEAFDMRAARVVITASSAGLGADGGAVA